MKDLYDHYYGASRKGKKNGKNDDRYLLRSISPGHVLVAVADGLGGHPAGHMAAELVMDCLAVLDVQSGDKQNLLVQAIRQADGLILDAIEASPELRGMGATATAAIIGQGRVWWAHIGDSRLYLLRRGQLQQITHDHSLIQVLLDGGNITPEEAETHPFGNVLDQCVGCIDSGIVWGTFELFPGDIILACTDGLHRFLTTERLISLMTEKRAPAELVSRMILEAVAAGSSDDITACLLIA